MGGGNILNNIGRLDGTTVRQTAHSRGEFDTEILPVKLLKHENLNTGQKAGRIMAFLGFFYG